MTDWLYIFNAGAVGLFGTVLSASFCDISWDRRSRRCFGVGVVLMAALQAVLFVLFDGSVIRAWYPLITHLPLAILLGWLGHRWLMSAAAVLTAYLCCQLRRWLGLLCVALFSGGETMQAAVELGVTLPLAVVLLRYAAPAVRSMSQYTLATQLQFSLIPAVSYVFDYVTRVYTDWLERGIPAAVEFMPFVCSAGYLVIVLYTTDSLRRQHEMEQLHTILDLQVKRSARQIRDMKKSQEQAIAYRHDLRHHLQYLSACLDSGAVDQAQEYIRSLHEAIADQRVMQYCENIPVNLILSSFAGRLEEAGVAMSVHMRLSQNGQSSVTDNDLCVLLSNALENGLNACIREKVSGREAAVEVRGYEKGGRMFFEIANSCREQVPFENGLPVAKEKGHGVGVRSICAVVEKYGGIYSFEVKDGRFLLRLSLGRQVD